MRLLFTLGICFCFSVLSNVSTAKADLTITISEGAADSVELEIVGTGTVGDNIATVLTIGTSGNTFLPAGLDPTFNDGVSSSPVISFQNPDLSFNTSNNDFFGDLDFAGLNSFMQFNFENPIVTGTDLSSLNGTYNFSESWRYSLFNPGAYSLVGATGDPLFLTGMGEINLAVLPIPVPEPTAMLLLAGGFVGLGLRRRRLS